MLNWDWVANRPATPPTPEAARQPGWWATVRRVLGPPLLDPAVSDADLGAWIDAHTMRVHGRLLERRDKVRRGDADGGPAFILDDSYGERLRAISSVSAPS
jgi:hypothetical protein